MPLKLRALSVSNGTIALGWSRPAMPNGVIKGYRLYFMKHNFTDVVTVRQTGSNIEYELHDLGEGISVKYIQSLFSRGNMFEDNFSTNFSLKFLKHELNGQN